MNHLSFIGENKNALDIVLGFLILWFGSLLFRLRIPFSAQLLSVVRLALGKLFLRRYKEEQIIT